MQEIRLSFGFFDAVTGDQHLTAVVQITFNHVGMVEKVTLTGCRAGSDLRNFRFVVRAASALTALGVPPFRIGHGSKINQFRVYRFKRLIFSKTLQGVADRIVDIITVVFVLQEFKHFKVTRRFGVVFAVVRIGDG